MKKLAVFGVLGVLAVVLLGGMFGFRTDCIRAENGLEAQLEANKSSYDKMWKTVREMAQVPAMYTEDLKKVYDGAIQGRYGANGSQAVLQFIKEHNPNFDSSLYANIQRAIEANRNTFDADQKQIADKVRQYKDYMASTSAAVYNVVWGFPRVDLKKFQVVTSDRTDKAFEEHKDEEIKLR
jgi:hypothetical protein